MTAGGTIFEYDREATRAAHLNLVAGADLCTCAGCRNFRLVRESEIYPPDFLLLLDSLGIDFRKEEEVCHLGDGVKDGRMLYGGSFYFVGILRKSPPKAHQVSLPGIGQLTYQITDVVGPAPRDAFAGNPTITVDFTVYAPWRLAEDY